MKKLTAITTAALLSMSAVKAEGLKGTAQTGIGTDYVAKPGFVLGEGPVNQTLVSASYDDWLSGFVWTNADIPTGSLNEADIGLYVNQNLGSVIKARLGYERWTYPSVPEAKDDNVARLGINYNGWVNADIELSHLLTGDSKHGDMVFGSLSKPFQIYNKDGIKATFGPTFNFAVTDRFFETQGLQHITPGLSIGIGRDTVALEVYVKKQFGFNGSGFNGRDSPWYGGINLKINY
jgi:hypothetical protein